MANNRDNRAESLERGRQGADSNASKAERKPPGYFEGESLTRRRLFERGAATVSGIAGAAVGLPAIGFSVGPVFEREEAHWESVGAIEEFSFDKYAEKVLTLVSGIGVAGKATIYVRRRDPETDAPSELSPEIVAISSRCTHLGCSARYFPDAKSFICPCHTSIFNLQGERISGPAPRPLDQFNTRVRNGQVYIGPRFSVNDKLEPVAPRDPGNHVDGVWKYLYPSRFDTPPWKGGR